MHAATNMSLEQPPPLTFCPTSSLIYPAKWLQLVAAYLRRLNATTAVEINLPVYLGILTTMTKETHTLPS